MGRRFICLFLAAALTFMGLAPSPSFSYPIRAAILPVDVLPPTPMWTREWDVRVRAAPSGVVLTVLDRDQPVRVTGYTVTTDGVRWRRVQLWGAFVGWVRADLLVAAPIPSPLIPGEPIAPNPVGPHAPLPLNARGIVVSATTVLASPSPQGRVLFQAPIGARVQVVSWATDANGRAWYRILSPRPGWLSAEDTTLLPRPGGADVRLVQGVGMWCTPSTLDRSSLMALLAGAKANHITHLYVEVGGSAYGFFGATILKNLLHAAHQAHIAVIAWVYPYLDNVPKDVAIAAAAVRYVAPSGDKVDGLMADVEQNMAEPYVRAYGQVLRAMFGPKLLMGITTYAPQTDLGRIYPFRTVAQSFDVIAPMDYWAAQRRSYSALEAYRFVADSVDGVRAAAHNPSVLIEPLGQMFDIYAQGRNSPSGSEILSAIRAARDKRATGISFFEWDHASPEEWDVLRTRYF